MVDNLSDNAAFRQGLAALHAGNVKDAERLFKAVLAAQPENVAALNLLGVVLGRLGRNAEAVNNFDRAAAVAPNSFETWVNRAMALIAAGRYDEAVMSFDRAIGVRRDVAQVHLLRAKLLADLGRSADALAGIDKLLAVAPNLAEAWLGRSNILFELKRYDDALAACDRAVALKADLAEAWHARGNVLAALQRHDEALVAYDKTLAINPGFAGAWHGRGNALSELKRHQEALAAYDRALAGRSDFAEAWLGRGNVLTELKHHDQALGAFDRALALQPNLAEAWIGRGNINFELRQYRDALAAYDRALALSTDLAEAWLGRGNVLADVKQYDDAFAAYEKALALKATLAEAWFGQGNIFFERKRYDEALVAYDQAVRLKPDLDYLPGARLAAKLYICDWANLQTEFSQLLAMIRSAKLASAPYTILATPASPADQLQCTTRFVQSQPNFPAIWRGEVYSHDRIRVAYLSADFGEHPVGYLTVGMFERHDRSRFEFTGLSFGPDQNSPTRDRIQTAFERFVDVRDKSDHEVAELLRRLEVDIAVDLMGFTRNNRFNIFARRPAPVQVSYMGYAASMGAPCIDYLVADRTTVPEHELAFFSERVVWLPHSYYANDDRREISAATPTRRECGLPEQAFVFCCFNNTFKITPEIFDIWMELLRSIENSVLWLLERNVAASANLRREAEWRGVSPQRLIFAARANPADHLARHRLADLFLDTLPYNAHTTACDALWAGLPVVTCLGKTFVGRVAASVLGAAGLDELVTHSLQDYQALAVKLACDAPFLAATKGKLARNRDTCPLFDTERFTRHMELAYVQMWERYQRGEAPKSRSGDNGPIGIA